MFVLLLPGVVLAQSEVAAPAAPPVGQQLVREGTLAVDLQRALALGGSEDEIEAESKLAEAGIAPRNGWIADYPVTPDIVGELYKSVRDAAAAGKLSMGVDEALRRLSAVLEEHSLAVRPAGTAKSAPSESPGAAIPPPPPGDLQDYYIDTGPPVVTYYAPPPAYYSMYAWVPYPFWWGGFWFTGFFILNDFHRPIFIDNRPFYVSNHFRDIRRHRVFRIDPYQRYRGRTYSGIGVRGRDGLSTGVRRSDRTIFNRSMERGGGVPGSRREVTPRRGAAPGGTIERSPRRGGAAPGGVIQPTPREGGAVPGGGVIQRSPREGAAPGGRVEGIPRRGEGGMPGPPAGRGGGFDRGGGAGIERGGGGVRGR